MSIADRCIERFQAAKAQGVKLSMEQVRQIIHEEETKEAHARPTTKTLETSDDATWIQYLESLPHLSGIDIKREIGKCQLWASTNNQKPTRRRIINWLNRSEKTVTYNGQGQSSFNRPVGNNHQVEEPKGWREAFPDCIHATWAEVPQDSKQHILKSLNAPQLPNHFNT